MDLDAFDLKIEGKVLVMDRTAVPAADGEVDDEIERIIERPDVMTIRILSLERFQFMTVDQRRASLVRQACNRETIARRSSISIEAMRSLFRL